jgi:type IV pilus assembly protein PilA
MMRKNRKGFTLVELIVVIAILAILAAIAIPRLSAFTNDAQIAADQATAATIYKAAQVYYANNGNLTAFDAADYTDPANYDAAKLDVAPTVDLAGDITAVTYGLGTYPN